MPSAAIIGIAVVLTLLTVWMLYSRNKYRAGLKYAQTMGRHVSEHLNAASLSTTHKGDLQVVYGVGDYFHFFRSLGEVSYITSGDPYEPDCGVAFVLRTIPRGRCWYIADYRVAPKNRGRWVGFRHLMASIAWPWLRCHAFFGLSMGTEYPKYLKYLRPFCSAVPVRFYIISPNDEHSLRRLPERYLHSATGRNRVRVIDRSGEKDLYVDQTRIPVLHLCPRDAPVESRGVLLRDDALNRPLMVMALPGEWEVDPSMGNLAPPLLGLLVHNFSRHGHGHEDLFTWLGSGDL